MINRTLFSGNVRALQKIARIKLQSGLRCSAFQQNPAGNAVSLGTQSVLFLLQNIVVVIAGAVFQVDIVRVDARADRGEGAKIKRRALFACHIDDSAGRQTMAVVFGEALRQNIQMLP